MPRSLYSTFAFHHFLRPINQRLKLHGPSRTFNQIVRQLSRHFIVNLPPSTLQTLQHQPVLLVCNHPSQAEVLVLLAALPPRKNIFLIAMDGLASVLPAIKRYIIPVHISHRVGDHARFDWKFYLFSKLHSSVQYPAALAHQKNIASITKAATQINQGSLVAIFPAGGSENGRDFLPGVGHLIKNLHQPHQVSLVMAHVRGTSSWDFFRPLPLVKYFLPSITIDFSLPQPISRIRGATGRAIASHLQQVYDHWVSTKVL